MPNGATHAANYKTEDFSAVVKEVTNNKGVDVIIDFVGQSHWKKNLESLAVDGKMTMLALMSGMPRLTGVKVHHLNETRI